MLGRYWRWREVETITNEDKYSICDACFIRGKNTKLCPDGCLSHSSPSSEFSELPPCFHPVMSVNQNEGSSHTSVSLSNLECGCASFFQSNLNYSSSNKQLSKLITTFSIGQ